MLELKIERMAESFGLTINDVPKEIENKHNVLINLMTDKIIELKKLNEKMNNQIKSLRITTNNKPKETNVDNIDLSKSVEEIKNNFDDSYDKLKKLYHKNISELAAENRGLIEELNYYKQRVKELRKTNNT